MIRAFGRREISTCAALALGTLVVYAVATWIFLAPFRALAPEAQVVFGSDEQEYAGLAQTLLSAHRFALTPSSPPEAFRTPGYPAFIAALLVVTNSWWSIVVVQILLSAFSTVLIYLLGTRYFSYGVGLFAAIVYSLDPTNMLFASDALTQTLYMFVFLLAIFLAGFPEGRRHIPTLIGSGILLGISALVRPAGLYIIPFVALLAAVSPQQQLRRAFVSAAIVLVAALLTLAPWIVRNGELAGGWSLSSISGYNALFYNAALFQSYRTGESEQAVLAQYDEDLGTDDSVLLRSFPYERREKALAESVIFPLLPQYAYFHIAKTIPFFIGSSIESTQQALAAKEGTSVAPLNISNEALSGNVHGVLSALLSDPWVLLERIFWLVVSVSAFCFGLASLVGLRDPRVRAACIFFLIVIAYALLTGPVSSPGYRVAAEPFLLLLAAAGFAATIVWIKAHMHRI